MKETFSIGDYELSIDSKNSTMQIEEHRIVALVIKADEQKFDQLCEREDFEFNYGIYPPEFYVWSVDLDSNKEIAINENNQHDHEAALYFMEHNEVDVKLNIQGSWIVITGWVYIGGDKYPLEIRTTY